MTDTVKYVLDETRLPKYWYNLVADLPAPPPPVLHPGTLQPVTPDDLAPLFPLELIRQEATTEREVQIPEPVRQVYRQWRPSPLYRARRLEKALQTPARIYYKYEGVSPAGSHKPNTAVPQAFYNQQAGVKKLVTETGAGQWGSSLAFAGALYGLEVKVFMVRVSYDQKPYRRALMETYGASCTPSPSNETRAGRALLAQRADHPGSLGIAISEAVEIAAQSQDTKYALGSVLNHVLLHQTVVGQEAMAQLEMAGDYPDVIVGCTGGGSNFAGIAFPFLGEQLRGGRKVRIVAVEPDVNNAALARKNCATYPQVEIVEGAVWPRPVMLEIENPTDESWAFRMREKPREDSSNGMRGMTIDELSKGAPIDLLKVDIEGGEKHLFTEETHWLSRVGAMLVELHGAECTQAVAKAAASSGFKSLPPQGEYVVYAR